MLSRSQNPADEIADIRADCVVGARLRSVVAVVLAAVATLRNKTRYLHDRLIGRFFGKSKHKHERRFAGDCVVVYRWIAVNVYRKSSGRPTRWR